MFGNQLPLVIQVDDQLGMAFGAFDFATNERPIADPQDRAAIGTGTLAGRHGESLIPQKKQGT
jgi:hypothetical protein